MLKVGDKVPDFEVDAYFPKKDDIGKCNSTDYKNRWLVLLFYPADFTFVCPTELQEAAHYYEQFSELNAEILSVSTDTAFVHKAWHDNSTAIKEIQYPMLADPAGKLCRLFGTYIEEEGLSLRGTFIIDPDGHLVSSDIHSNAIGRSTEEILRKLQAANFVRENDGLVCPASWKPGKDTIKPGTNLIGKI